MERLLKKPGKSLGKTKRTVAEHVMWFRSDSIHDNGELLGNTLARSVINENHTTLIQRLIRESRVIRPERNLS